MKVTVYSTKTCPYCVMTKQWLTERTVRFTDLYIDTDTQAMQQMIEISGQMSVPYTLIERDDGTHSGVIGFDIERLKSLLGVA